MKNKTIGVLLSIVGIGGTILTVLLVNLIEPCCNLFMIAYHQISAILVPVFIVILITGLYLYFKPEKKVKIIRSRLTKILTEDEKFVINSLKRGDNVTQAELCRKSGFSKAKLSMLLEKMQKRGLLRKVKRGRTNIVVLNKKI